MMFFVLFNATPAGIALDHFLVQPQKRPDVPDRRKKLECTPKRSRIAVVMRSAAIWLGIFQNFRRIFAVKLKGLIIEKISLPRGFAPFYISLKVGRSQRYKIDTKME